MGRCAPLKTKEEGKTGHWPEGRKMMDSCEGGNGAGSGNIYLSILGLIIVITIAVAICVDVKNHGDRELSVEDSQVVTETSNQPVEVIDLGWRDVVEVKDIGGSQAVVLFRNNPSLPTSCDDNNTRMAVTDRNHPPYEMFSPLITLDHKKAYILEIKINRESKYFYRAPFTIGDSSYVVKMGNLPAELAKANLPR